jgi:acetylornithine deacetylase/succinyl-diaminopimelate desuccinylase-like protein
MSDRTRSEFKKLLKDRSGEATDILLRLLAIPSENPPADTGAIAQEISVILQAVDGVDVELVTSKPPITNIVAILCGHAPGRRLIFNGHLDTFEIGDESLWSARPSGELRNGRVYGRGAADMKGGVAAQVFAARCLADFSAHLCGELVLTLTGDEQSGGDHGTAYLLENHPHAVGNAMMCADAGSPRVLRFGEKGTIWMTIEAEGVAGHGAHTHLTVNAIDRLVDAISAIRTLRDTTVTVPSKIAKAISDAAPVSETLSGNGEAQVLKSITVNLGTISGGSRCNLAADHAQVTVDIRFPPGLPLIEMKEKIAALLDVLPGITYRFDYDLDVNMTDPGDEIIQTVTDAGEEIMATRPVATMRVGSSDAALYRFKGIPSVICGLTPHNMGGVDEYVDVGELETLGQIYALSAFDFLANSADQD